ncbi:hypothetical protein K503DRAFT_865155 [Rhizopogon vinicolor AM-OR11-026]|uniref:Uncharacterized protein n=1 Tax=Rhizopogon vinicolor AM-OR11-026 TaxID=1314800 RepID=A0A1B7N4L0_9AGAM|nr:hypothetical protein K503DRAFT_865155 [Rhizopogon vinicolor AM-OR11-026]
MFGSPSHLLTPSVSASAPTPSGSGVGTPTPVNQPPPSFSDVRFETIGKPLSLLSRISAPNPANVASRSPSPHTSPPSPVPPVATLDYIPNQRSLAERIGMDASQQNPSIQPSGAVHEPPLKKPRINHLLYPQAGPPVASSNLIPPIEVLSTASESNLPPSGAQRPPLQQDQTLANGPPFSNMVRETATPELVYPTTTPTIDTSSLPDLSGSYKLNSPAVSPPQPMQSPVSMPTAFSSPHLPFPAELDSSQVPEVAMAEAPQQQVVQDTLSAIYARLRVTNDALASRALPTSLPRSPSPLTVPSNISELAVGLRNEMNSDGAIVLRHPYPQSNSTSTDNMYQDLPSSGSNALALTGAQTPNLPVSRSCLPSLVETMHNLQAAAGVAAQHQLDYDQAFESERMEFYEHRKAAEERMLAREAEYQAQMQAVQKQLEEIRAREHRLVVLEEESRLREETRRARDAQRRARDDQRKLEDESRRKATQEDTANTMQLLEEAMAEKQRWQEEKERAEKDKEKNSPPLLSFSAVVGPRVEKEDGMTEEEIKTVNRYNAYLTHAGNLSAKLIADTRQFSNTLLRMKETRLQAAEAECQRIRDEEESQKAQAEAERQRAEMQRIQAEAEGQRIRIEAERQRIQVEADRQRIQVEAEWQKVQAEAERQRIQAEDAAKCDEEKRRCRDQVLNKQGLQQSASIGGKHFLQPDIAQQQVHPELQKTYGLSDTQAEYVRRRAQVLANKQQITAENASRIRAERAGLTALPATHGDDPDDTDIDMEVDGQKGAPHRKHKKTSYSEATSGNVMLGTPSTATSLPPDAHTTPTTVTLSDAPASYKTPSFVSASTEVGRQVTTDGPLYPTTFASDLNLSPPPNANGPVPTSKNIPFPTTPKSQTILASQINVGPLADLSPAHRDANLRHIKMNRYLLQSNSGDRHVKRSDDEFPTKTIKTEEVVDMPHSSEPGNTAQEGMSTQPMDATVPAQNYDPPPAHDILNPKDSQQNDVPQVSTERIMSQISNTSSRADPRVGSVGGASRPMLKLSTTPISPDPWGMDASVERRGWTAIPVSPRSEPLETAQDSRQHSQNSARTPSPESFPRSHHGGPHYPDRYTPYPLSPTSSHPQLLEQNEPRALHPPALPSRPRLPNARKRSLESDNEDDSRNRRRPRGDYYVPERDRDSRNIRGLNGRHSPATERPMRRPTPPNGKPQSYQPRSPGRGMKYSPTIPDRQRIRNDDSYRPDYPDVADSLRRPLYMMEEHTAHDELQDGVVGHGGAADEVRPALLDRMSSAPITGGRGNPARGRGRGRGDSGRGRGGRGRAQPPPFRSLEDRISLI